MMIGLAFGATMIGLMFGVVPIAGTEVVALDGDWLGAIPVSGELETQFVRSQRKLTGHCGSCLATCSSTHLPFHFVCPTSHAEKLTPVFELGFASRHF